MEAIMLVVISLIEEPLEKNNKFYSNQVRGTIGDHIEMFIENQWQSCKEYIVEEIEIKFNRSQRRFGPYWSKKIVLFDIERTIKKYKNHKIIIDSKIRNLFENPKEEFDALLKGFKNTFLLQNPKNKEIRDILESTI